MTSSISASPISATRWGPARPHSPWSRVWRLPDTSSTSSYRPPCPQTGAAGLQNYIVSLEKFAASHPGSISAIEGLNEANHQPFSYNGSSSLSAAAQFQSVLYQAVKGDAALSSIPVFNLSLACNDPQGYSHSATCRARPTRQRTRLRECQHQATTRKQLTCGNFERRPVGGRGKARRHYAKPATLRKPAL